MFFNVIYTICYLLNYLPNLKPQILNKQWPFSLSMHIFCVVASCPTTYVVWCMTFMMSIWHRFGSSHLLLQSCHHYRRQQKTRSFWSLCLSELEPQEKTSGEKIWHSQRQMILIINWIHDYKDSFCLELFSFHLSYCRTLPEYSVNVHSCWMYAICLWVYCKWFCCLIFTAGCTSN